MSDAVLFQGKAWLLIAVHDEERQHAGNLGYDDDIQRVYRYDSMVPNSQRIRPDEIAVLRSKTAMLGLARIERLVQESGTKELRRCIECGRTTIKERKTIVPRYRCYNCKAEFREPRVEIVEVTKYAAHFGDSFVSTVQAIQLDQLRDACPQHNGQLAMQRIDLAKLIPALIAKVPSAAAFF